MNPFSRSILAGCVAVAASLGLSTAQAHSGVSWSIGINVPGYPVGVGAVVSGGPYVVAQPVYVAPPVVYAQPAWGYPAPVVVTPSPVYYGVPVGRGYEGRRHRHHREGHEHPR